MVTDKPAKTTPRIDARQLRELRTLRQLKTHGVAFVSLLIALTGLAYNTWRNETSEAHRNIREAGFRVLVELGELQQIIDRTYYFKSAGTEPEGRRDGELWTEGWGKVAMIRDLTRLIPGPAHESGVELFALWQKHAASLTQGSGTAAAKNAEKTLSGALKTTRDQVVAALDRLR